MSWVRGGARERDGLGGGELVECKKAVQRKIFDNSLIRRLRYSRKERVQGVGDGMFYSDETA